MSKFFCNDKNKLYCFTPEVMLATFFIEIVFGAYAFVRYRTTVFGRMGILVLFSLALFQISEYQVCGEGNMELWARIGFISVTFLPVIGLHMITFLTRRKGSLIFVYALAVVSIAVFTLSSTAVSSAVCSDNYIIFHTVNAWWWLYPVFYFGTLLLGIWYIIQAMFGKVKSIETRKKKILAWILLGYVSFLVPMAFVYVYYPDARHAVPSVMCGFAVIFAFILAFRVLPLYRHGHRL